ncbi:MAG: Protoporphyrinogen oxidase-like protein [Acidobacteriaceae bacterium]|nr:Protoporphyrinogen oxidase-like protein [Acidobacteriaceae bacterium]
MTGLAASMASGWPIYEACEEPGGICSSYYVTPQGAKRPDSPEDGEAYRFEIGGGHWIFGGDPAILRLIRSITPVKQYQRSSAVFFPEGENYVPYPLQNHLSYLPEDVRLKAVTEMLSGPKGTVHTMGDWLEQSFGRTLTEMFFAPFHKLYTAGLWEQIVPQDGYKSPVDAALALRGAFGKTPAVGYNTGYLYPEEGLGTLARRLAEKAKINYCKRAARIHLDKKEVEFADGSGVHYDVLISTLPLDKTLLMAGVEVDERPDPYSAVLVLNIGARRGPRCPDEHWLYLPDTRAGFHRVGFYSNVDESFLPASSRKNKDRVSIYIERAYPAGKKPSAEQIASYVKATIAELKEWGFVEDVEVADPTWVEVAYTWAWPGSRWRSKALQLLEKRDVAMVGRYGRWIFQGIADSLRDGLYVGAALRAGQ